MPLLLLESELMLCNGVKANVLDKDFLLVSTYIGIQIDARK